VGRFGENEIDRLVCSGFVIDKELNKVAVAMVEMESAALSPSSLNGGNDISELGGSDGMMDVEGVDGFEDD
jgi:hypothetical protein